MLSALEALWTSVVADVCSQHVLVRLAAKLPDLTVVQLLEMD